LWLSDLDFHSFVADFRASCGQHRVIEVELNEEIAGKPRISVFESVHWQAPQSFAYSSNSKAFAKRFPSE
jgi:hypothetical protein